MRSAFGAKFTSFKKAIEEGSIYRYYCRVFGMRILKSVIIYENNILVVLNTSNLDSNLQCKVMALSCHFYREYILGEVV